MISIDARNVHEAFPKALNLIHSIGEVQESRNGRVLVAPYPITTLYRAPLERVIFWSQRDANPFFHFFESLWMLAGRDDVAFPASFAKQLGEYSDDGATIPGAYGYRWRNRFDKDQLQWIVDRLRADPNDRRVVLSMWDPYHDPEAADKGSRDVPCNTNAFFRIRQNPILQQPELCMQVNCRSNDIIWGAYGANAVHFSYLLEYLACRIGVAAGWYAQNSFNWHAYTDFFEKMLKRPQPFGEQFGIPCPTHSPYTLNTARWPHVRPYPLMKSAEDWDQHLLAFLADPRSNPGSGEDPFFPNVACPLYFAHQCYKEGNYDGARNFINACAADDWKLACREWLDRRANAAEAKASRASHSADTAG